jgi:predicted AlkP superfamily phosphohydrolase/phosphomutase
MNFTWLATFGMIFTVLLTLALSRRGRRAAFWGVGWAIGTGFAFLAPWFVRMHHLHPTSTAEWTTLAAYLACGFALLGALLSLIALPFIGGIQRATGYRFRSGEVAWCAITAISLPVLYIVLSITLEYVNFGRLPPLPLFNVLIGPWIVAYAVGICLLWLVCRRGIDHQRPMLVVLHVVMVAVILSGLVALPFRIGSQPLNEPIVDNGPVVRTGGSAPPLLIIGLDGGNWRPIEPMLKRGSLPTLQKLLAKGARGQVDALWHPYWSAPAWGAMFTGYSREEIGVYEDLTARAPGLPLFDLPLEVNLAMNPMFGLEYLLISNNAIETMPPPRSVLRRTPFWELLTQAGAKTAVFRLHFTYPATKGSGFVVSNRVGPDLFEMLSIEKPDRDLVYPPEREAVLMSGFADTHLVSRRLIDEFNPTREKIIPADVTLDPTEVLSMAEEIDDRTLASAAGFVRSTPDIDVVAVHVVGFDNLSHAFSQYRFPGDYRKNPPAAGDVKRFGQVIDRYLEFLDAHFARLIAAFPEPPNVIVLSDHGHGPSETSTLWRDFHAPKGLFISAGPDIPHTQRYINVSYYDILPTILELTRFSRPETLRGQPLFTTRNTQAGAN